MRLSCTASSELMIVSPSRGQALTSIGAEPVAMTIACAVYSSVVPSFFLSATVVFGGERRLAVGERHVVRFEQRARRR